jgi:hypothetical protein
MIKLLIQSNQNGRENAIKCSFIAREIKEGETWASVSKLT